MLTVFTEHYLTPKGRLYFPTWIAELGKALDGRPGFKGLEVVEDVERPERQLLMLTFEDTETLMRWTSSKPHRNVTALLERHQIRKPYTQLLAAAV